ncbi:MAG TPA: glycosyltransferase family 4 protein [Nitrolancea sp.]|nr:glycosyltransferase family 4 protein [Nitrolancea sp.]
MRLIFVNRFFHPDHSATSQMLTDLATGLAAEGRDVIVVTSRLRYDDSKARLAPCESFDGVSIERIWTSRFGRARLLCRAVDYLTFYASAAYALALTVRPGDIVVAMTDPPALSVVAAIVAKCRGAVLVNWLQDVFPEVAEALNVGGRHSSLLFTALRVLRNVSLRRADMNVVIGELMAARLRSFAVDQDRIATIPNWADVNAVRPVRVEDNDLRRQWNLAGEFVVAYSGNLGRAHDVETVLGAIAAMAKTDAAKNKIRWLFIGGGALYEQLRRESEQRAYAHVIFRPYQPRESLSESISVADAHIVSLKPELEGSIVPSKFYGIAAAGRPTIFIGSPEGEIAHLISRHGCGATVNCGDSVALVATVTAMAESPHLCRAMGDRARAMCEERFSKTSAIETWQRLVGSVARSAETGSREVLPAMPPIEDYRKS